MRNKSIDLETCKQKNITVCGTDMHPNPTAELTWALILGLARNLREETENMYQGSGALLSVNNHAHYLFTSTLIRSGVT